MSSAAARRRAAVRTVLATLWRAQRRPLALGALLAAATALAGMALLGISGWFIGASTLAGLSLATAVVFDVFAPSAAIRLLALGRTGLRYGERLVTHDATLSVLAGLRVQLFRGWARPRAARWLLARPARLLFRLTGDVDALEALYLRGLVPLAVLAAATLAATAVAAWWSPLLGAALLLWLLGGALASAWWIARRAQRPARRRTHALEGLRAATIDLVAGQSELAMAGRLQAQCAAVAAADQRLAAAEETLNRLEARGVFAQGVLGALALAGSVGAAAWLVEQRAAAVPVAIGLVLLVLGALEALPGLRRGALEHGRAVLAATRLAPRLRDAEAAPPAAAPLADGLALLLRDADATPGDAGPAPLVLRGCGLQLRPGERVALLGASGAGKSTLLALAAGELQPVRGSAQAQPACLLTQRSELFQDSLRENLLLARPAAGDAELWSALEAAGLAEAVRALPPGLDTGLGEGGLGLSVGQARRLALARLLLRDAPLWLLDEPTEGVDPATARDVLARIARKAEGRTLLVATHLLREAALADRLVLLEHGAVASDVRRGTPAFDRLLATLRPD